MKISTDKLCKLIQETLDERSVARRRATMIYEIRDMGDDLMSELWDKKEPQETTNWEDSVADEQSARADKSNQRQSYEMPYKFKGKHDP